MKKHSKIRLAFLIPSLQTGGAELQLLSLVKGLDPDRFRITVITLYSGYELEPFFETLKGVQLVRLNKRHAFDFSAFIRLIQVLRQGRFSLLQCYNVSARLWGVCAAQCAGVSRVITMERTARLIYSTPGSRFYLFAERYALRKSDLVIANSQAGKDFALSRGARAPNVRVVYNGLDSERLEIIRGRHETRALASIPAEAFCLTWVGRLETVKDPFTFIKALHLLNNQMNRTVFAFMLGSGSLKSECEKLARSLDVENRIVFTGNRKDVADFYHAADLVVLSSSQVEGCSNTILEAMSLGIPVAATRVGGNSELIQHARTGYLFNPQDAEELAVLITKMMDDPDLLKISRAAQDMVRKKFGRTEMTSAYVTAYNQLLNRTGG